ncbi:hypothetical protein P348_03641 [Enterobacter sp. DC3]|nr:hypothetical protein P348_03641 [Enterobacter sp. DC3]EWG73601.1 hypothetical protein P349_03244 [Enterobacter sp. DC4]
MCVAGLRIAGCHDINTRDSGYRDKLSCVTAWRLTANCEVCNFSLLATEALQERFHENTKYGAISQIRSRLGVYLSIIILAYWASKQMGDPRFADPEKALMIQEKLTSFVKNPSRFTVTMCMCKPHSRATALRSRDMRKIPAFMRADVENI